MTPVSPVISKEHQHREVVYAKDQPEYLQLPAYPARDPMGHVITRWKLSWRERWAVFFGGSIWLTALTFDPTANTKKSLQPIMLETWCPVRGIRDSVHLGQVTEWIDMSEAYSK